MNQSYTNSPIDLPNKKVDYNSLTETKVVNINDFIFNQNLEFYPNLSKISCQDNTLIYKENNEELAREVLTFDLRTLPGSVWTLSPKEFLSVIKINKDCKGLLEFASLLNQKAFDQFIINNDELELKVSNYMSLYFSIKESFSLLTEDNKIFISNMETLIATTPKETAIGAIVNKKLDEYLELTKTIGDEKGKTMALVLKNKNLPSLIEEDVPVRITKAGYINIAILLYGMINIAFIVAVALMK